MNEQKAKELLPLFITAFQKFKSNTIVEVGDGKAEKMLYAKLMPYIFGEKDILPHLVRVDNAENIAPSDFYNVCFMLHGFAPEIVFTASILGVEVPEPDTKWVVDKDWYSEDIGL